MKTIFVHPGEQIQIKVINNPEKEKNNRVYNEELLNRRAGRLSFMVESFEHISFEVGLVPTISLKRCGKIIGCMHQCINNEY